MTSPEITIQPDARSWSSLLRRDAPLSAREFREQLGLPTDRPVIISGHQAQVWHPGILAKVLASHAAAERAGAAFAWLVVDQDDHEPFEVRYPVRTVGGTLESRMWRLDGGASRAGMEHTPTANRPTARNVTPPAVAPGESFANPGVESGLARIAAAMRTHERVASAARQVALATLDPLIETSPPHRVLFATSIARTSLFAEVVARLRADPSSARETYNEAVRKHPTAGVTELAEHEVPLWHIPAKLGSPRRRATAAMLAETPPAELAPRALLMTGLIRWAAADLFVHGLGGAGADGAGGYDCITSEWFKNWLGADLAPTAMVTATLRLNIATPGGPITPEQIARTRWVAHAARHRPCLLGDAAAEAARDQAVATLQRLRWKRDAASKRLKLETYRGLHSTLEAVRTRRATDLARLDAEAATAAARKQESEIIADRTWAWPLYEPSQIAALKGAIDAQFDRR